MSTSSTSSTSSHVWPVRVTSLGEAVSGTLLWSSGGERRVTVVVKGTFAIAQGKEPALVASAPLVLDDEHLANRPGNSLRASGELSPYLPRVDVFLTGHAYAPAGQSAGSVTARLSVQRDGELLVNKSIRVQGDWSDETGQHAPFQRMQLIYERALGGPGSEENPAGVGLVPGPSPNLVDPRGRPIVACFAPIPRRWPLRARLLRSADAGALESAARALPEGFDGSYFQAAPVDQRLDALRGDETILLDGMHATLPHVELHLPSARGAARVYGPGELAAGKAIELRADTVHVDTARETCTILWRGHFSAQGVELHEIDVVAGIELPERPIAWPAERAPSAPAIAARAPSTPPPPDAAPRSQNTIRLSASDVARQLAALGLQVEGAPAPVIHEQQQAPKSTSWRDGSTLDLTAEAARGAAAPLPFEKRGDGQPRTTLEINPADVARISPADALPFVSEAEARAQGAPSLAQSPSEPAAIPPPPASRSTLELDAADVARISPADALPFSREPVSYRPVGSTMEIRPEDVARLTPADALPFAHEPARAAPNPGPAAPASQRRGGTMAISAADVARLTPADALPFTRAPSTPPPPQAPDLAAQETANLRATVLAHVAAKASLLDLPLAGADLHELDLSGAALAGVDLTGAKLARTRLTGAHLAGAKLAGADLSNADLTGADLSQADLSHAILKKARLDGANLTDASLVSVEGQSASFTGAVAVRASFVRGQLDDAAFGRLHAASADFHAASLAGARFAGADLTEARFETTRAPGAVLDGARLGHARGAGAELAGASLRDVDAPGSVWEKATFDHASFAGANLEGANLRLARAVRASFAGARLGGADMAGLTGDSADLRDARLEGANLQQARFHDARFDRGALRDVVATGADLERSRFDRADLTNVSLHSAKLAGASFAHAELSGADLLDAELTGANVFGASRQTAKLGANARALIEVDLGDEDRD